MSFPAATPGQRAAGTTTAAGPKEDSPQEALAILSKAVDTPRGQAALKTLRSELDDSPAPRPSDSSSSPGMKAAKANMPAGAPPWSKK